MIPSSLYTCRYWAFSSRCPDDKNGMNDCKFAHYDAGQLASHLDQRGTCQYWLKGNCRLGFKCWYEHRLTGVDGMYQGPITLTGVNLEIANAAAKSGFNHWNHKALYDLIWAVKRAAVRQPPHGRPVPRRANVYPDRYRPSGYGDNTGRKRSAASSETATGASVKVEIEHNRGSKRQKVSANQSVLRATAAPYQPQLSDISAFQRQDSFVPLTTNDAVLSYARKHHDMTPIELKMVRSKLDRVVEEVKHCRTIMRQAFDRYSDHLRLEETIEDMNDLAKHLELAEDSSKQGVEVLAHVRDLLERL